MNPGLVAFIIGSYFVVLIVISRLTADRKSAASFYNANRSSAWYLVAFGMIGASLSGVTFISVPGEVGNSGWYYFQIVMGYLLGYLAIGKVLLPLYYKMNLISIYSYLEHRMGKKSYQTGAFFFLISRVIGASFRLFLVAGVLQIAFFDAFGLPFWSAVLSAIVLIWLYTFQGGIKTIVWTDTLQTAFMLLSVLVSIYFIKDALDLSWSQLTNQVLDDDNSTVFNWEWDHPRNFFKQFFAGAFIAIVMTGLDQDMMQKNLTCRNLQEAQKNMLWFSISLLFVNLLFLVLGVLLYQFADVNQIALPTASDQLFPLLAVDHFPVIGAIIFLLGITAAAYSSADSALTALTTSFCIDFLGFNPENFDQKKKTRMFVHFGFSLLIFFVILIFEAINDQSVINSIFTVAGYTYGPLLGLFSFGLFTKWRVLDKWVPLICFTAPLLTYVLDNNAADWFGGYQFGFELLMVNGALTFIGLMIIRLRSTSYQHE